MAFSYIGEAKTAREFVEYVQTYNFGSVPPSFLVIHHTVNPDASWARMSGDQSTWWDRNEAGLAEPDVIAKRKRQLDSIRDYYISLGWSTGPHLFVDNKYIWLFTGMYDVGTHAASGNSFRDSKGTLHYSIGIEVVGYYEQVGWPSSIQQLLQVAVQTLKARLRNFDIIYTAAPTNRPDLHDHQVSFHDDYNKPSCPGSVITPEYAIPILSTPFGHLYKRYQVIAPCAAVQAPAPDALLADGPNNGQTHYAIGDVINIDSAENGWLHVSPPVTTDPLIRPGIGFIMDAYAVPFGGKQRRLAVLGDAEGAKS